jgi:hypothetical protein
MENIANALQMLALGFGAVWMTVLVLFCAAAAVSARR